MPEIPFGNPIPEYSSYGTSVSLPKWQDNINYEEGVPSAIAAMKSGYPRFFIALNIRRAEYCLHLIEVSKQAESGRSRAEQLAVGSSSSSNSRGGGGGGVIAAVVSGSVKTPSYYKRPAALNNRSGASAQVDGAPAANCAAISDELEETESLRFIEERYGRNLNSRLAEESKLILKKRISGIIVESGSELASGRDHAEQFVSRGVCNLSESDVFLTPTGMSSIFHTHRTILDFIKSEKSICFGFPYTDTLKILSSFGPGSHFFGLGEGSDYDELEALLSSGTEQIAALFTETPSNPLLKTPDLQRLRNLADKYKFVLVVDDSISNFVNLDTLNLADVVVSSLTKLFSGDSNVMGG
ncbi:putative cystathionine gamma-synthase, partial [Smittium culicis]